MEIIYELVHVGVLNNGQATIMQVAKWFEQEFQIKLVNVPKIFKDIRNRRKETTSLPSKWMKPCANISNNWMRRNWKKILNRKGPNGFYLYLREKH